MEESCFCFSLFFFWPPGKVTSETRFFFVACCGGSLRNLDVDHHFKLLNDTLEEKTQ